MASVLPPDLRALMDIAAASPPPGLPEPWPAVGQSVEHWAASVAALRGQHEAWAQRVAVALADAGASGGGAPGGESPTATQPPRSDALAVTDVADGVVRARIYTPPGDGPFPAVVQLHGGGWWIGGGPAGLAAADGGCRLMCLQLGAVVVNVDYRQAPEHRFPIPLEDSYAATCWTLEHARELHVDPARVAVMGPSAGGNLAAAVALLARDRGGPQLRFVLLMVPALDATQTSPSVQENGSDYEVTAAYLERSWDLYLGRDVPPTDPLASPLHHPDLSALPPTHVVVAEFDPLRDDGIRYVERLAAAGVDASLARFPMGHSVMTPAVGADYLNDVLDRLVAALSG